LCVHAKNLILKAIEGWSACRSGVPVRVDGFQINGEVVVEVGGDRLGGEGSIPATLLLCRGENWGGGKLVLQISL
jgi:hypothetical protein